MYTLTVDDRQLLVTLVQTILKKIDPSGNHMGAVHPQEALEIAQSNPVDVAFLDVEMPDMNGIELARKLQDRYPLINIVFVTGFGEYMPDAFSVYASDYIMKPVSEESIRRALSHLRYSIGEHHSQKQKLKVQCFGAFDVFVDGKPVKFTRSKTKELLAYLVDRNGAVCTTDMLLGNLWPEDSPTASIKSNLRTITADLRNTLDSLGTGDVLQKDRGGLCVDTSLIDCDYYRFLNGDPIAVHQFRGEYMTQYAFAEETAAMLQLKFFNEE